MAKIKPPPPLLHPSSSGCWGKVGSTSCGSFLGRECYESLVDLKTSFWDGVLKFRLCKRYLECPIGTVKQTKVQKSPKSQKSKFQRKFSLELKQKSRNPLIESCIRKPFHWGNRVAPVRDYYLVACQWGSDPLVCQCLFCEHQSKFVRGLALCDVVRQKSRILVLSLLCCEILDLIESCSLSHFHLPVDYLLGYILNLNEVSCLNLYCWGGGKKTLCVALSRCRNC